MYCPAEIKVTDPASYFTTLQYSDAMQITPSTNGVCARLLTLQPPEYEFSHEWHDLTRESRGLIPGSPALEANALLPGC